MILNNVSKRLQEYFKNNNPLHYPSNYPKNCTCRFIQVCMLKNNMQVPNICTGCRCFKCSYRKGVFVHDLRSIFKTNSVGQANFYRYNLKWFYLPKFSILCNLFLNISKNGKGAFYRYLYENIYYIKCSFTKWSSLRDTE